MEILIAEDDPISRKILETILKKWDYQVLVTYDGIEAWKAFNKQENYPKLAILDWMMPCLDGITLCRKIREQFQTNPPYIIMLTAKGRNEDIVTGFEAGADDYITKPFDREELKARVKVGARMVELRGKLSKRVKELEEAMNKIKKLHGLLPICSYCKKIRDDKNYWTRVEEYITQRSNAKFSHSVCPECYEKIVKPQLLEMEKNK
ncbi:response regulator [Candidatus Poribacteria bacterium]|nr:response regulator [Candidatus Poribacteria bacterium]